MLLNFQRKLQKASLARPDANAVLDEAAKLEEAGQRASGNAYLEGRQSEAAMVQSAGNEKRQR